MHECELCGAYMRNVDAVMRERDALQAVLKKYIEHVSLEEGTDFLSHRYAWFSDDEWNLLQKHR